MAMSSCFCTSFSSSTWNHHGGGSNPLLPAFFFTSHSTTTVGGSTVLRSGTYTTTKGLRGPVTPVSVRAESSSREPMMPPFNVLITDSTQGIGYALAREFLKAGDNLIVCSRSAERVESAVQSLAAEFGERCVWGTTCDVREGQDVKNLVAYAQENLKYIDIWAIKMMLNQPRGGHVFNIDGAGSDGRPTPRFAAYGATKRSVVHLTKSLQAELQMQDVKNVIVHNLSPGMVTTDLLMSGATTKQVAEFLVPNIRSIAANATTRPTYIRFLTGLKAYSQIFARLAFGARRNRYVLED